MNRKFPRTFWGLPESLRSQEASRKLPGSLQGTPREPRNPPRKPPGIPPDSPREAPRKPPRSHQEAFRKPVKEIGSWKKLLSWKKCGFIRGKYKLISSLRIHVSASIWALFSVNEIKLYTHCQFSGFSFTLYLVSFLIKKCATQFFLWNHNIHF